MTVRIRPVSGKDQAAWRALWRDYLTFYKTERTDEVYAITWARIMDQSEKMFALVAEKDAGRIVGIANFLYHRSFWDPQDSCYLNDLFVDPKVRGSGTGRALIDAVISDAKKHNSAQIYWSTAADNQPARLLYDDIATLTPFVVYEV